MTVFHFARVVVEASSPLSIASGEQDARYDVLLARDANGLPMIPATAIAGALRRIMSQRLKDDAVDDLFGRARQANGTMGDMPIERSPLRISSAVAHAKDGVPVDGLDLKIDARLGRDEVLRLLSQTQPVARDHVRLSERLVADDAGKFERSAAPRGARFTFDIVLTRDADPDLWRDLLDALADEPLRIGGATRRGYGALVVISIRTMSVDPTASKDGLDGLRAWPRRLDAPLPTRASEFRPRREARSGTNIRLKLQPLDFWRIGGENDPYTPPGAQRNAEEKPPHLVPCVERSIVWRNGTAEVADHANLAVPGSSIKGALRHRSLFHYNRLAGRFAAEPTPAPPAAEGIDSVFGYVREAQEDGQSQEASLVPIARAGSIIIDDAEVADAETLDLWRNGIDRFAGGVRNGVLFGEQLVFRGTLTARLVLGDASAASKEARRAFGLALLDLVEGRLAIGAGASKGNGFMKGELSDPKALDRWVSTGSACDA